MSVADYSDNSCCSGDKRFNLKPMVTDNHMKPPGHWNSYKIHCVDKTMTLWANGVKQSEFTQCNNPEGYLGLEAEGSLIQFRHLQVIELP